MHLQHLCSAFVMAAKPEPNVTVPAGDAAKGAKVSQSFRILLSRAVLPSYVPLDLQGQVLPVPSDRHHRQGSSRPQPPRPDWPPVRSGCRLCLLRRQQELGHHMVRNAALQFCRVKQSLLGHPSPPTLPPLTLTPCLKVREALVRVLAQPQSLHPRHQDGVRRYFQA